MLYRCDCEPFNKNLNICREFFIKQVSLKINKAIFKEKFENLNLFLIDPGGLLDEFNILKKII